MARTRIGNLRADLSANSAAFKQDMDQARRALGSSTARMNRSLARLQRGFARVRSRLGGMARSMFSLRGIVAQVAGGAGLGLLFKNALDTADAIAKNADATGLATDAYQRFRVAAGLAGIEQETFNQAMTAFAKRLGEAKAGRGTFLTFLNSMEPGFKRAVLGAESTEEALRLVLERMRQIPDAASRAALGAAAFSRTAGVAMGNLAQKDIPALLDKIEKMGVVIPEKLLRNAESAKDELSLLGLVIKTQVTAALLKAAPAIAELANDFREAIPDIVRFGKTVVAVLSVAARVVNALVDGLAKTLEFLARVGDKIRDIQKSQGAPARRFNQTSAGPGRPGPVAGFRHGGRFTVPGAGGFDSQLVTIRATPGETVAVSRDGGGGGPVFNIDARGADLGLERRLERTMRRVAEGVTNRAMRDLSEGLA